MQIGVVSELEIYPSEEVRSPGAIVIASIVALFIVFYTTIWTFTKLKWTSNNSDYCYDQLEDQI